MKPTLLFVIGLYSTLLYGQLSPCDFPMTLSCGDNFVSSTIGGGSNFDNNSHASCNNSNDHYDGNDFVFILLVESGRTVHINLNIYSDKNLDLFLLKTCNPAMCMAASQENNTESGISNESIEIYLEPDIYYILVDGPDSSQVSEFSIDINCECNCTEEPLMANCIRNEDFEDFQPGFISPQSTTWRKFDGIDLDGNVEDESGNNYLRIRPEVENANVIYDVGQHVEGRFRISWDMYIEDGFEGTYRIMHQLPDENGNGADFAYSVFFNNDGTAELRFQGNPIAQFQYVDGEWFNVMQIIDLYTGIAELWINHKLVHTWFYGTGIIAGIQFLGNNNDDYRVDKVCMWATGIFSCPLNIEPYCVRNGDQYQNQCMASVSLYSTAEGSPCYSICDYAGSLIFRDDIFEGSLDENDEFPPKLLYDPCVLGAIDSITLLNSQVEIKVFYNAAEDQIIPIFNTSDPDNTKLFVFECYFDPKSQNLIQFNLGQVGGIDPSCEFDQQILYDTGFYYMVIIGPAGSNYTLQVFPSGECPGNITPISCNQSISTDLSAANNDYDVLNHGNYANCYNGVNLYEGKDRIFSFDISEPSIVNINFQADDQKAVFLYNFLCAKNCMDVAQTPPGGGIAEIAGLELLTGRYYLIVDSDISSDDFFSLSLNCQSNEEYFIRIFDITDPGLCPVESEPDSIHSLTIPRLAFPDYLKPDAHVFVGHYTDQGIQNIVSEVWEGQDFQLFELPKDSVGDLVICGFEPNDSITLSIYSAQNGDDHKLISTTIFYENLIPGLINAQGKFTSGGKSSVKSLARDSIYNFEVNPPSQSFSSSTTTSYFLVRSNVELWDIEKDEAADWLEVDQGNPVVYITVDSNDTPVIRETFLKVRFYSNPEFVQYVRIAQNGTCINPEVSIYVSTANNAICEGVLFSLEADVTNGLDEYFSYLWNTGDTSRTIHRLAVTDQSYEVTVTEKKCLEQTIANIDIDVTPVPVANAGADRNICPGEHATLGELETPGYKYEWSNGDTTSMIIVFPNANSQYLLTVTNNGCSALDSVQVNLFELEDWSIRIDSVIKCNGDLNGQLSVYSQSGGGGQSFVWSNGGVNTTLTGLGAGIYNVTVVDTFGCFNLETAELTQPDPLLINNTVVTQPTTANNGKIEVMIIGGTRPYSFEWLDIDGMSFNGDSIIEDLGTGCYRVVITDANGCQISHSCIDLITSLSDLTKNSGRIHPNPTNGIAYVLLDEFSSDITLHIANSYGEIVEIKYSEPSHNESTILIDLTGQPPGVYFIYIKSGYTRLIQKLVIQ